MGKAKILIIIFVCFSFIINAQVSDWRGPGRTGVYPDTNLLKAWPEGGPELQWFAEGFLKGHSSVAVAYDRLFFTGLADTMDVLMCTDMRGELLWQTSIGRAWTSSFSESRSTPVIAGERIFVSSGFGDIACVDPVSGAIIWSRKASEEFKGTYGKWGIAESMLVLDDKVFFTPGGNLTTMIAMNQEDGSIIWKSESLKDNPSYTSPMYTVWEDQPMIISVTESYLFGIDPGNGEILWKFDISVFATGDWRSNIQTNTPLFDDGKVFFTSGYNHFALMIELSEEADAAYFVWSSDVLDVHHGGVVKVGNYLYGSNWENNRMGNWCCLNWETGQLMWEENWHNKGPIIAADGMIFCYDEKDGNVALVNADPAGFTILGTFQVPYGDGPHWSHPVIHEGMLYIRHGGALMVYDINNQ